MVDNLIKLNFIAGVVLLLSSGVGIYDTLNEISLYGWAYEQTTIINEKSNTNFVNNYAQLFSALLVLGMGLIFLANGNALNSFFSTTPLDSSTGIIFPNGEPEYWFIEHNPSDNTIRVGLNEFSIDFPLSQIIKEETS